MVHQRSLFIGIRGVIGTYWVAVQLSFWLRIISRAVFLLINLWIVAIPNVCCWSEQFWLSFQVEVSVQIYNQYLYVKQDGCVAFSTSRLTVKSAFECARHCYLSGFKIQAFTFQVDNLTCSISSMASVQNCSESSGETATYVFYEALQCRSSGWCVSVCITITICVYQQWF